MLTLNDGRTELWQWDTGRALSVDADCSQVHFSNKVFGRSIDVDVTNGVAIIPDILLQTDKELNVWAFVGTAENGYTKISKTFNVNRRNKPADYVFTPTDQMTLQTIQNQIGDLADLTTEAKDTLVAAINEAAESGGGSSDAVLYTQQALTDSQKKQARENIDAASSDFVINGTLNGSALTLDKTYNQIQEAVQAGKSAVLKVENAGAYFVLPLIAKSGQSYMFTTAASLSPTVTTKYTAIVGANGASWHVNRVATYGVGGKMAQVSMDSDPSQPMEIATKQYVDASGLPSVTDADNGKVLRVVNSAWSAADMPSGADGKSAYAYAVEGGYTGTEAEFAEKLASGALIVHVTGVDYNLSADKTYADIMDAILAGTTVLVDRGERYLPLVSINIEYPSLLFGTTICVNDDTGKMVFGELIEITQNGEVKDGSAIVDIPTTLPNPNALTFTGAVTGSYDGSAPLTVNIPNSEGGSGGGGDVFELIGEATSSGVSDTVGLTIPFNGSLYKTIVAYAYNLPAGNNKRIIIRKKKAWYDGCPLGWNGMSGVNISGTWGFFGAAIDVCGKLFTLGAAEANDNGGHGFFRFFPQNGALPTLSLSDCKFISLDCNSNSEILPDGCSLIVWGVRK